MQRPRAGHAPRPREGAASRHERPARLPLGRRRVPQALQVDGALRGPRLPRHRRPPLRPAGARRHRLRRHRAREHHPQGGPSDHARGHPRRQREGARLEPSVVRRRSRPGARDAERATRPLSQRSGHPARPGLVAAPGRHPSSQPGGAADVRGPHPGCLHHRRRQVAVLEDAYPRARGRPGRRRGGAQATHSDELTRASTS